MSRRGFTNFTLLVVMLLAPCRGWAEVDPCREDFNADLSIGVADAATLRSCMTGPVTDNANIECVKADFQRDHHVDLLDAAAQYNKFGPCHLCPGEWAKDTFCLPGVSGSVYAMAEWDDGGGPALYVGGTFTTAGCANASNLAKWDGLKWTTVPFYNGEVRALAVFDDGTGPTLYVGGLFPNELVKWNGVWWSPLGAGIGSQSWDHAIPRVNALAVYDDGSGAALYVGGEFSKAGTVNAQRIARWDGTAWSSIGDISHEVFALTPVHEGNLAGLYAGGWFHTAGGRSAIGIARWNGIRWSSLGGGIEGTNETRTVRAIRAYDDGGGQFLFVGGKFFTAGGVSANHVARWDGTRWSALDQGLNAEVNALEIHDDGGGPVLYAGGSFSAAGASRVERIAKWDGQSWSAAGAGFGGTFFASVFSLAGADVGEGRRLYAGGRFGWSGSVVCTGLGMWNGENWSPLGHGAGLSYVVNALAVLDGRAGSGLFAGGDFETAGNVQANRIARWNGKSWSALGVGASGEVHALTPYNDDNGPNLIVGGVFDLIGGYRATNIARWDGTEWSGFGMGAGHDVRGLAVVDGDAGVNIFASGQGFDSVSEWNGKFWTSLKGGHRYFATIVLHSYDDGNGEAVYAGGRFFSGSIAHKSVAKWDGTSWLLLGGVVDRLRDVHALIAYDDGLGPTLYAGAFSVKRWDGASWLELWPGIHGSAEVNALVEFDDGSGPTLYAGGRFETGGDGESENIARLNGTEWQPLGSGTNEEVNALAVYDDGNGPALYAGGWFTRAGGAPSNYIAKWQRPLACDGPKTGK